MRHDYYLLRNQLFQVAMEKSQGYLRTRLINMNVSKHINYLTE